MSIALGDGKPRVSMLTPEGAQAAWDTLRNAVGMLDMFGWQELLDRVQWAHSAGHIIDPTGYKALIYDPNAEDNRKLAEATATYLRTVQAIAEEARERKLKQQATDNARAAAIRGITHPGT